MSRWAEQAVDHVRAEASGDPLDRSWRVTLNFHPDRVLGGLSVIEALAHDGVYRSQFETRTSNGGHTAYPGGARWQWERRMFGHAYDDAPAAERPKYGALNHRHRSIGGAARFGSCHLRLAGHVLDRTTFCFPDSVFDPAHFGTADRFDLIPLAEEFTAVDRSEREEGTVGGVLDDYVEAHVHGVVRLGRDVEAIVLDPSFRGTAVHVHAGDLGVSVEWHEGRTLTVQVLAAHPDYRGEYVVTVGTRIAQDGLLDARVIGAAAAAGGEDPQDLKKVWHHVARYGRAAPESVPRRTDRR